ncbi:MAG TPA: F0F1 ATP synthase subunit delta [Dokdonella sp.]|uniref:F0F1 ATP synthase subunit delta n=1 Tax=Dokdonella sp. TaxID=2291710 RepID=UPI002D7EEFB0|nr:F0F1 ATP synthase subunit delta [Dokdonella sp.]HET9032478.1 F0F1 ATP synthase subunit delta [Dokdonella sp.]
MSSALTLARPYARAAFETAHSHAALASWAEKLAFAAEVATDSRIIALLGNPRLSNSELASLFIPHREKIDTDFGRFISLLADNGRLHVLPEIAALFEQLKLESERTLKVRLRTATRVDEPELEKIRAALKRRFDRDIELTQSVDPKMMGGAIIDAGETVIDGSIRGRLARLEQALVQ